MAVALGVVVLFVGDYGYSWDEVWHGRWYGQAVMRFFATFGSDRSSLEYFNFHLYGALFDLPAECLAAWGPFSPRTARHLLVALWGLAGVWGTRQTARRLGSPAAGFWAALFLLGNGLYFGHLFMNYKDIPFAGAHAWALYALVRLAEELPRPSLRVRLGLGAALGAMLGVRAGGVFFLLFVLLLLVADAALARGRAADAEPFLPRLETAAASLIPALALAYVLMLATWPAGLLDPFSTPLESLLFSSKVGWSFPIFWNGAFLLPPELPWTYLPTLFAVKLPLPFLLLIVLAAPWVAVEAFRSAREGRAARALGLGLMLPAAFFAPVTAVAAGATLYDNLRHFLFVLGPLAILAALGWTAFVEAASRRWARAGSVCAALLVLSLAPGAVQTARLHPYEYVYLNILAGGMPAGEERFETDYWATSYGEASTLLLEHARGVARAQGVPFEARRFVVGVTGPFESVEAELPKNFFVGQVPNTGLDEQGAQALDYLVETTRYHTHLRPPDWPVVARVGRLGMTFSVVKANPGLPPPAAP